MPVLQFRTHFDSIILSSITCLFCFLLIVSVIYVTFSVVSMHTFFFVSNVHDLIPLQPHPCFSIVLKVFWFFLPLPLTLSVTVSVLSSVHITIQEMSKTCQSKEHNLYFD